MLLSQLRKTDVLWLITALGFISLYIPTYHMLFSTIWQSDEQGHGPIILLIAMFLFWQKKHELVGQPNLGASVATGVVIFITGLLFYIVGRSQGVLILEVGSQVVVLIGIVLYVSGAQVLRKVWFPIFFLIFMIPLPGSIVDMLTLPMKIAVSNVSEYFLYNLGFPIARDGVILQIGYYKLLVADACAGLHTVFTLEAMGLLYLHLIKRDSFIRNVSLAVLIVPISFLANTIRVMILVLVTYYYGDEVGQGFIHDFAGFVLFGSALVLIISVDTLIHRVEKVIQLRKSSGELQ